MSWLGAVVEGVGMIVGANQKAKAAKEARIRLEQSRDFALKGPINDYVKAGTSASKQTNDLLGLNGNDPAATQDSQTAFDKYLNSTGYKFQQSQGTAALDASAASKGLTGSGSAIKAAVGFGQGLGSSYFDKYLGQLSGVANRGLNAATVQGNMYNGASTNIANNITNAGNEVGNDIQKGTEQAADFLGFNDKSTDPKSSSGSTDPSNTNSIFGDRNNTGYSTPAVSDGDTKNYLSGMGL